MNIPTAEEHDEDEQDYRIVTLMHYYYTVHGKPMLARQIARCARISDWQVVDLMDRLCDLGLVRRGKWGMYIPVGYWR